MMEQNLNVWIFSSDTSKDERSLQNQKAQPATPAISVEGMSRLG